MLPTLADGDFVIARTLTARTRSRLREGQIVRVEHPNFGALIKRLSRIDTRTCQLDSDGQIGSESSSLGELSIDTITHRGWFAITRAGVRRLTAR